MNLLKLYPIQSCNLNCYYCPMKQWTYPIDAEQNKLNNKLIFNWLDKYCPPKEWLFEITGGEPAVYPEIESLIYGLADRGYYGEIKTNGTLPIPKTDNFIRVAAWHEKTPLDTPPLYVDKMLIMRNPNDKWEDKVKYCEENNIPHWAVHFYEFHLPEELRSKNPDPVVKNRIIRNWTTIYSGGRISGCHKEPNSDDISVQNMSPPRFKNARRDCPYCGEIGGFEMWLPDEWIEMFKSWGWKQLKVI